MTRPRNMIVGVALLLIAAALATEAVGAETVTYYYTSPQGTVLATTDIAGQLLSESDYRPYGAQIRGMPGPGPSYAGHIRDADTGLTYMQARYYDPLTARFLSVDSNEAEPSDPYAFDRYGYAKLNPITNIDPDGRQSVPLDAYSRYWPGSEHEKEARFIDGMAGTLLSIATMSNVFDVAPAGSGSGAVASSGLPGEFALAGGITRGTRLLVAMARAAPRIGSEELANLPRMRVLDTTSRGAAQKNYSVNWSKTQFESHLKANGYTMDPRGPVSAWFDRNGDKVYTTRDFSKSGGPTGELFHSSKTEAVAKFRFDQHPGS